MQRLQNNTVLVLGSGGKLGGLLRKAWAASPPEGIDLIYQSRGPLIEQNTLIWSPEQPTDTLPACDSIIALWGVTSGDVTALQANVDLARESRRVAQATGAQRVFHFSSAAVYGNARDATAGTPLAPVNLYGESKLAMEQQVARFVEDTARHCCLRVANVIGADSLADPLRRDTPVTLDRFAGDIGPERSYIGARDLARILTALSKLPAAILPTALNITGSTPIATEALLRVAGKTIEWRDAPASALQHVSLCAMRLRSLLPQIEPLTDAADLIADWQQLEGAQ